MEWIQEQWEIGNHVRVIVVLLIALFVMYSVADQLYEIYVWGDQWWNSTPGETTGEEGDSSIAKEGSTPDKNGDYASMMTDFHNNVRRQCKVPNMTWDTKLAEYAQDYANQMANAGKLDHHLGTHHSYKDMNAGENLAMSGGLRGEDRIKTASINAINGWAGEGRKGPPPAPNHYTAMVWKGSKSLGCGVAEKNGQIYTACNYANSPPNMNYASTNKTEVPCTAPLQLN